MFYLFVVHYNKISKPFSIKIKLCLHEKIFIVWKLLSWRELLVSSDLAKHEYFLFCVLMTIINFLSKISLVTFNHNYSHAVTKPCRSIFKVTLVCTTITFWSVIHHWQALICVDVVCWWTGSVSTSFVWENVILLLPYKNKDICDSCFWMVEKVCQKPHLLMNN